jgi:uncharacterized protein (PEP-CTERM system associated)
VFLAPLLAAAPSTGALAEDWRVTPSIEFGETFTDNVNLTPTNRTFDWVQSIAPRLNLTVEGARVNANITGGVDYLYFDRTNQDDLRPQVLGTATVDAIEDLLQFNFRTEIRQTLLDPAGSFSISPYNNTANRDTLQIYAGGPTLYHRLGSFATAQLSYLFSYFTTNRVQTLTGVTPQQLSDTYLHEVNLVLDGGPRFDKFEWNFEAHYNHSHAKNTLAVPPTIVNLEQEGFSFEGDYLVTNEFALIGIAGYDHIHDSTQTIASINIQGGFRYAGGFEIHGPKSSFRITAGRRFGGLALDASATYRYSARTTMTATYTDEVTSSTRRLGSLLGIAANSNFADTFGLDPRFTLNDELFRSRRGDLTLQADRGRNTMAINGFVERRFYRILPRGDWVYGGQGNWDRQLNRTWTFNSLILYTHQNFNNFITRRDQIYAAEAGVTDQFARSLKASLTYRYSLRNSSDPLFDIKENAVTLLLTAVF